MNELSKYEAIIKNYRENGFPKIGISDQGDGTYKNPILHADYSDPDVIRVEDDFYMISSSFNCVPGIPILHSKDLINWTLINHVITHVPYPTYDMPQHGKGIWAPSIRYNNGYFWVYVGMPDEGIFMSRTRDPFGKWEPLQCIKVTRGWIDTCPFWDDDGSMYLVNGFAKSRIGFKSVLSISRLADNGKAVTDEFRIVFDGNEQHATIEGPKLYKRNGYYYIFAPAGGVETGYQVILRSRHIYGPYEDKIVLHQGNTGINGPHQGGWVELENGESWFMHFQDKGAYGRIVHLQPMYWENDWPVIGMNQNAVGVGEPVLHYTKPGLKAKQSIIVPATSDDFDSEELGLQWQWQANYKKEWYTLNHKGFLRLFATNVKSKCSLWEVPNLLLQKFPAVAFKVTIKANLNQLKTGDQVGLILTGMVYKGLFIKFTKFNNESSERISSSFDINIVTGNANDHLDEIEMVESRHYMETVYLQLTVEDFAKCRFGYSFDGSIFKELDSFWAVKGQWIGAKFGLTCLNYEHASSGFADFDWCIIEEPLTE